MIFSQQLLEIKQSVIIAKDNLLQLNISALVWSFIKKKIKQVSLQN